MAVNTASGCTISIGTTTGDNSNTQSEYEADSYDLIGEVTNIGEFGRTYREIVHSSIDDRNERKFKGQRNDGTLALQLGRDATDTGQEAMIVARDDDHDYNFKVTLNDASSASGATPTTLYFRAKVMSYRTVIGDANQVVQARTDLGIQSGTLLEVAST